MEQQKPTKAFKAGPIQVAVFMNRRTVRGQEVSIPSVSFQKRYRDGEEWKSTNSLDTNDVPKAILALTKAYDYLVGLKPEGGFKNETPENVPVDH
ncbi:MAG: hypothetical protein AAB403_18390 [Planctomycetota bacterium]